MNIQPHFEELFELLERHGVEYMIVGGYAVAFHGNPRFTKDVDIFFRADGENVGRLRGALVDFGFETSDLPYEDFLDRKKVLTFGVPPNRVDLLNDISGVAFEDARPNVVRGDYGKVEVSFIGLADLLRNKRSSSRARDAADVEELESQ